MSDTSKWTVIPTVPHFGYRTEGKKLFLYLNGAVVETDWNEVLSVVSLPAPRRQYHIRRLAGGWATKSQKEAIKLCIKLVADGDIQRATGEC